MFSNSPTKKHPNRLLEIFVVLVILALVVTVLVQILNNARHNTENITTVSQVREYRQALDAHFIELGYFPYKKGSNSGIVCLGNYQDDTCWHNGDSVTEDVAIFSTFIPDFLIRMPDMTEERLGVIENQYYSGMIYQYSWTGKEYSISYFLTGKSQSCVLSGAVGINVGTDTLCTLHVSI